MRKLDPGDLLSLEQYARERAAFRERAMQHRRARQLALGGHCTWSFEDRLTIQYQVQEMLRAERIFEPDGIAAELESYNPLIPDGANLKATLMIEYEDPAERARQLIALRGLERQCWIRIEGCEPVVGIADEDLERQNDSKTSAVHFLRFEFPPPMIARLEGGAALAAGIDHASYRVRVDPLPEPLRAELLEDFD